MDHAGLKLGSATGAAPPYQGSVTYGEKGVAARNVPQEGLSRDGEEEAGREDRASEVRSGLWSSCLWDGGPGVRGSAWCDAPSHSSPAAPRCWRSMSLLRRVFELLVHFSRGFLAEAKLSV